MVSCPVCFPAVVFCFSLVVFCPAVVVFCSGLMVFRSGPVRSAQVGSSSIVSALASRSASVSSLSICTWTWPSVPPPVPPPLHLPPGSHWSVWKPLFGGGGSVTNPVCVLPPDRHQRSLLHHIDFHSTQAVRYDSGLQFPSSTALTSHTQLFALITLTPENHLTITQLT